MNALQPTESQAWILQDFLCTHCGADLKTLPYDTIDRGTFQERGEYFGLRDVELVCHACQKKAACPNCGECGGSPYSVSSREFQGDSAHGGYVEWVDEGCTLCMGRSAGRDIEDFYAYMDDQAAADREAA